VAISLAGCTILIIEDEPLVALGVVAACEQAGATTMTAHTLSQAERLVETEGLSAAVIDFRVGSGNTNALCLRLAERQIPFVMHSAYTKFREGNDAVNGAAVVPKPATSQAIADSLACAIFLGRCSA
jgi:DNA-binding NtrC family response regulator